MALANVLGPDAPPAYILIGVDNDGTIVGIPPATHLDDADLHQKVAAMLSGAPRFAYIPVEVDGLSVGVYEIRPGGRPFFARVSSPPLQRPLAVYRNGTATELASPALVIEWHKEDDAPARRLRSLDLEEREAERRLHAVLNVYDSDSGPGRGETFVALRVSNLGRRLITLRTLRWRVEWTPEFLRVVALNLTASALDDVPKPGLEFWRRGEQPPGYEPPSGTENLSVGDGYPAAVAPGTGLGEGARIPFSWSNDAITAHFDEHGIPGDYVVADWVRIFFEVEVVGELGTETILRCSWP
jgi:hypothetical protein